MPQIPQIMIDAFDSFVLKKELSFNTKQPLMGQYDTGTMYRSFESVLSTFNRDQVRYPISIGADRNRWNSGFGTWISLERRGISSLVPSLQTEITFGHEESLISRRYPIFVNESYDSLVSRFEQHVNKWLKETQHLSSPDAIIMNDNYQRIIGFGPRVLPLILDRLYTTHEDWFWALRSITGEDPISPDHYGDVNQMVEDWIHWGQSEGYIKE